MAGNLTTPGASVASRLFAVLDTFGHDTPEQSLSEVAASCGLPVSTTKRLLNELTIWGGVERMVDNRYRIGMRLWEIGIMAARPRNLRDAATPLMHDLCSATKETAQLVVLDGMEALCVEKTSAAVAVPNRTEVGGRLPLHATAVGKCLLAHSPRSLLERCVDVGLIRLTPHTIIQPGRLVAELKEARRTGCAYSKEEMTLGAASVAAPIVGPGGVLRGALGIVVRSNKRLDALTPAVKTAALSISRTCA